MRQRARRSSPSCCSAWSAARPGTSSAAPSSPAPTAPSCVGDLAARSVVDAAAQDLTADHLDQLPELRRAGRRGGHPDDTGVRRALPRHRRLPAPRPSWTAGARSPPRSSRRRWCGRPSNQVQALVFLDSRLSERGAEPVTLPYRTLVTMTRPATTGWCRTSRPGSALGSRSVPRRRSRPTCSSSAPGPSGLYATYYAGFRGLRVALVDSLPELGGQVTAMYPEKLIFDVAGFPSIKGRDLVAGLVEQAASAHPEYFLDRTAVGLTHDDDAVTIELDDGTRIRAGAAIITAGIGKFSPRPLPAGDGWVGPRHGVLRAELRAVRRQGRRHRRRRRQRLRLGAAPRAGRQDGHPRAPPRRLPRPPAHRRPGEGVVGRDRHQGPGHRAARRRVRPRRGRGGRDHRRRRRAGTPSGPGGRRRPRLPRRPGPAPAVGDRGLQAAHRGGRRRCAPTCIASSRPAT